MLKDYAVINENTIFAKNRIMEVKVYLPIGDENENKWAAMWGEENVVFSLESVQKILDSTDDEIHFNFDCDGGVVSEGLAIYDAIRTSGKKIYCNIDGGCHSMAIVMLLAAPKENRSANPNCRALIHKVRMYMWEEMTADELQAAAEAVRQEQDSILDIYADRTGTDRETLEKIMNEEKVRTAQELLNYGFISKINTYNTNSKKSNMKKGMKSIEDLCARARNFARTTKNRLEGKTTNYDHTDADGNVLFSTEVEDDTLEVGMAASPDGTFELPDGRTIVIAEGVITEIMDGENQSLENLQAENQQLRNDLAEATEIIEELQSQLSSNYKPANNKRVVEPRQSPQQRTVEDIKNEMKQRREKKGGK